MDRHTNKEYPRMTDFLVNEVDKDGHVVHLETTDIPKSQKSEKEKSNGPESVSSSLPMWSNFCYTNPKIGF